MKLTKTTALSFLSIVIISLFLITSCNKKDNPVSSPDVNPQKSAELDTTINVDTGDAYISFQDSVTLHIPQGTVSGDTKLTITKLTESSVPADSQMDFPNAFEITLGSQHHFDKPLDITLKYNPKRLIEGKLKYQIGAAFYNDTLSRWELFKNVSVDTINNTISFSTFHLTKLAWWQFKRILGYTDYITSPHFIIYWTDGKVPSNSVYKSSLTNHKGTAPYYVQDILYYLEEARAVYKKDNLTVPTDTTDKAEVRLKDLGEGVDGQTSYFGYIQINQNIKKDNYFSQAELVQVTCAHELLHYVQDYYYMLTFEGNVIKWWLEATAVQADRIVWPNKSKFEAISYADGSLGEQLDRAWDDCNSDPNYYIAGGFLTYLTTYRNGAKLSIPDIIIETGKASKVSYFRTIIDDHLKKKLSSYGIGYEYRDYIKWAYEHKGPIKITYIPPLSSGNDKYVVPVRLTETSPTWNSTVTVPNLAVRMVKIFSPTTKGITHFKITLNKRDTQIDQYVYISDKDKTVYQKYLTVGDTLNITLEQKNQWIDILSNNIFKNESGSFDMSVKLVQAPAITSITPSSASVGDVVQIKGNSFGASQNTGEVWFGNVKALASDIVSWLNTQIDVKVPAGATTGSVHVVTEGKKSNDVDFTVGGGPTITEIVNDYDNNLSFSLPAGNISSAPNILIRGKNFGSYQNNNANNDGFKIQIYVNGVRTDKNDGFSPWDWTDSTIVTALNTNATGKINVKIVTSTGESNEFPYFIGYPSSYLASLDSLMFYNDFNVQFVKPDDNSTGSTDVSFNSYHNVGGTQIQYVQKDAFSWNDYTLTIDLSKCGTTNGAGMEGTMTYTFSDDGLKIKKVEIHYKNTLHTYELNYTGINLPLKYDYLHSPEYESHNLIPNMSSISGYVPGLNTSYTISGLNNQSSIILNLRSGL